MYFHAIPQNDTYKDLFGTVIYMMQVFKQKGCLRHYIAEKDVKTNYESTKSLINTALGLICDGVADSIFKFIMEFEYHKIVCNSLEIAESELLELTLAKDLLHYVRQADDDSVYRLLCYVCTSAVRNELTPTTDWINIELHSD
ncbi:MAG: hypothetical protein FWG31_02280 [Oscillospiraceae bacterium]|nr:hypothetical protein [Oscillospiraceae bacterium]